MRIDKDLVAASATPLVLGILADGESYGYAILKRVDELSGGRMLFVLEGGYSLRGLREGVEAVIAELLAEAPSLPSATDLERGSVLERLVARSAQVHGTRIPGIGAA